MTKCHDSLVSSVQVTELAQSIQDVATLPSRHRLAACLGLIAAAVPLADPCLRIWLTHNRTPRGYGTERQSARSDALPFSHPFLTLPSHKDSTNKQVSVIVFHWTRALARQSPPQTITEKCHLLLSTARLAQASPGKHQFAKPLPLSRAFLIVFEMPTGGSGLNSIRSPPWFPVCILQIKGSWALDRRRRGSSKF